MTAPWSDGAFVPLPPAQCPPESDVVLLCRVRHVVRPPCHHHPGQQRLWPQAVPGQADPQVRVSPGVRRRVLHPRRRVSHEVLPSSAVTIDQRPRQPHGVAHCHAGPHRATGTCGKAKESRGFESIGGHPQSTLTSGTKRVAGRHLGLLQNFLQIFFEFLQNFTKF